MFTNLYGNIVIWYMKLAIENEEEQNGFLETIKYSHYQTQQLIIYVF
jgi:hypothetical protein